MYYSKTEKVCFLIGLCFLRLQEQIHLLSHIISFKYATFYFFSHIVVTALGAIPLSLAKTCLFSANAASGQQMNGFIMI